MPCRGAAVALFLPPPSHSQVDQTRLAHIALDELARRLEAGQEDRQVTAGCGALGELEAIVEDVPGEGDDICGRRLVVVAVGHDGRKGGGW